jgi:molybdate transport repressor ModE-like protein
MLNFERMRILHAVATRGSVNAAARALHVTDSAVSQQIAKLEIELGQTLLERNGRGVRVTSSAAVLVEHAQRLLSLLESAEAAFDAQCESVSGQLAVAAFPTAARGLAPLALQSLRDSYPNLRIVLSEREAAESIPLLVRGDVDLVIAMDWENAPLPQPTGLEKTHLLDDVADVALPANHPLAAQDVVDLEDLRSDRWITWGELGTGDMHFPARWCDQWLAYTLRSFGHEPSIAHTAQEHATQLALVRAGLGICVMPRLGRDPLPRGVRIVGVRPVIRRQIHALWRSANTDRKSLVVTIEAFRGSASLIAKEPTPAKMERSTKRISRRRRIEASTTSR